MLQSVIADLGVVEVQRLENGKFLHLFQAGVGNLSVRKVHPYDLRRKMFGGDFASQLLNRRNSAPICLTHTTHEPTDEEHGHGHC